MRRLAAIAVGALVLAACPGNGGDRDRDDEGRPLVPQRGGVLRVAVTPLGTLDPAQARTVDQLLVADQLFDSLTTFDPGSSEAGPSLAARWQTSPDLKQWDFFLRAGAMFANGRAVTAADVKYSLERIAKPASGSPGADLLLSVSEVVEVAPDHVRIVLDQPWSVLPLVLSSPVFGVVPRESVEAAAPAPPFAEQPVGSGPFAFKERTDDTVVLAAAPGSRALLAGMELVTVADVAAGYRAFVDGRVDVAQVPPEEVDTAGRRYGREAFRPYLAELFYGFNLKNPKFADVRFREAIVRGIDRRAVVRAIYGNTVRPLDGVVVAGLSAHQDTPCGERCAHDAARAKALVAEVFGTTPPPEVQLAYDEDEAQEAVAKAIESSLEGVGIPVALAPKPLKDYKDFAVSGQQELFRLGWIARYPSADDFLPPLFLTGSPNNLTGFSVPAVDEQLRAARAEPDPNRRTELFRSAERAVMEAVPIVPIAQFQLHVVVGERVRGFGLTSAGTFDGTVVWLDRRG
ncbi:MAG TPA: ABC transporter substrate-binding protein [Acidimicrobiales bacterium]|nr:ABC transporter substrate-binding protein [Acidimicrobiales bacterium]